LLFVAFFSETFQVSVKKAPQSIKKSIKIKAKQKSLTGSKMATVAAFFCHNALALFRAVCRESTPANHCFSIA
jgi:hypothetical protein